MQQFSKMKLFSFFPLLARCRVPGSATCAVYIGCADQDLTASFTVCRGPNAQMLKGLCSANVTHAVICAEKKIYYYRITKYVPIVVLK